MRRLLADAWPLYPLADGWELAASPAGRHSGPEGLQELEWIPASVPGTVAGALSRAGTDDLGVADLDGWDWWYRTVFDAAASDERTRAVLWLDGLATIAEVYLDRGLVLECRSMFSGAALTLDRSAGECELIICLRALAPRLEGRRRPRARWRTRLVPHGNLRFVRTMLLGRAPGLAAAPAVVGPYRPVLVQHLRHVDVRELRLRARLDDGQGVVSVQCELETIPPGRDVESVALTLTGPGGGLEAALTVTRGEDGVRATGQCVVAEPRLWWPHTHGAPVLYDAGLTVRTGDGETVVIAAGRVGFRDLRLDRELEDDGLALACNGARLFLRGAVWTPVDLFGASEARVADALHRVVGAGMNMLRVPGIACYESPRFHDLCDELGILVWQDFMFANLDYPEADAEFMRAVAEEAEGVLEQLGHRPSLAVLCGGSEVAQQVAMLGLDPALAEGPLFGELLPRLVREADVQAPYVPSTPWGGELPFRPHRGVANYYGVGAYLRPLEDARRSDVRFSGECLALANVPDPAALEAARPGGLDLAHADWKRGVQRDAGAGWDFEDVRDHYLRLLHDVDPVALRSFDPERYLELSRHVSGEVMAEVFGEWRREASPCAGGLVLWLGDLRPGAGWGLLDHRGQPKVALRALARALAPVAVWTVDEGLRGVDVHVANDSGQPLCATLRVSLYRDRETLVEEAVEAVTLAPRASHTVGIEQLLGRFVDVCWAYRFGPPAQDLIVVSLERADDTGVRLLSQSFRHPAGRPAQRAAAAVLGLEATLAPEERGRRALRIASRRLAYGVRIDAPGFTASDDAFSIEPGHARIIDLEPTASQATGPGRITALNLDGSVPIADGPDRSLP